MKRCPKCNFELDPVDIRANRCPVCGEGLDARRKLGDEERRKFPEGNKVKRPL